MNKQINNPEDVELNLFSMNWENKRYVQVAQLLLYYIGLEY